MKYNDSKVLLDFFRGYVKAVNKGDISPLIGFDLYEIKAKEILSWSDSCWSEELVMT
ncbi:MAG: hypothetical protein V8T30_02970 [Ruminococcus sp.]